MGGGSSWCSVGRLENFVKLLCVDPCGARFYVGGRRCGFWRAAGGGPTKWDVGHAELSRCEEVEHEIDASSTQFPQHTYDAEESALLALLWWGCGGGEPDSFGGSDLDGQVTLGHPPANYPPKQNPPTMDSPFPPPRASWLDIEKPVRGREGDQADGWVAEDGWSRGVGATRLGQS